MLLFVKGQAINEHGSSPDLVEGSIDFVEVKFKFSKEWEDYDEIIVQFQQTGDAINVRLDRDTDSVMMPPDVVAGPLTINLKGYKTGSLGIATNIGFDTYVKKNKFSERGRPPVPPTPDLYMKLLENVFETSIPLVENAYIIEIGDTGRVLFRVTKSFIYSTCCNTNRIKIPEECQAIVMVSKCGRFYSWMLTMDTSDGGMKVYTGTSEKVSDYTTKAHDVTELERQSNRVSKINKESATDDKYPSVMAVYNFIEGQKGKPGGTVTLNENSVIDSKYLDIKQDMIKGLKDSNGNEVTLATVLEDLTKKVVNSSDGDNKVKILSDGTMEVNAITTDKLVQPEGDILLFSCGSSSAAI